MHELTYNYQVEFHLFQQVSGGKYYAKKSAIIRRIFILAVTLGSYLLGLNSKFDPIPMGKNCQKNNYKKQAQNSRPN